MVGSGPWEHVAFESLACRESRRRQFPISSKPRGDLERLADITLVEFLGDGLSETTRREEDIRVDEQEFVGIREPSRSNVPQIFLEEYRVLRREVHAPDVHRQRGWWLSRPDNLSHNRLDPLALQIFDRTLEVHPRQHESTRGEERDNGGEHYATDSVAVDV